MTSSLHTLATAAKEAEEAVENSSAFFLAVNVRARAEAAKAFRAAATPSVVLALLSDLARARAEAEAYKRGWKLGVDVADVWYRASDDGLFWVAVCSDDQLVSHLASTDTTEKPNAR